MDRFVRVDADKVNYRSGRSELGRDVFVVPGDVSLREGRREDGRALVGTAGGGACAELSLSLTRTAAKKEA